MYERTKSFWNPSKLVDLIHLKQRFEMCLKYPSKCMWNPTSQLAHSAERLLLHTSHHRSASKCLLPAIFVPCTVRTPYESSVTAWVTVCYLLVSFAKRMQSALPRYCAKQHQMEAETTVLRRWQLHLDGVLGCELSGHRKTAQRPQIREPQFRRRSLNSYFYYVLLLSKISTFFRIYDTKCINY